MKLLLKLSLDYLLLLELLHLHTHLMLDQVLIEGAARWLLTDLGGPLLARLILTGRGLSMVVLSVTVIDPVTTAAPSSSAIAPVASAKLQVTILWLKVTISDLSTDVLE